MNKVINKIQKMLVHACVISGLVCITANILDYYNPYMNFWGHVLGCRILLYVSLFLLVVIGCYKKRKGRFWNVKKF